MPAPYSNDLRSRVAASVLGGRTCRETAALFNVSVSSVVKWSQRLRASGSADAKPMGGVRRAVLAGERDWLLARIAAAPDLTLSALAAELAERGVVVSIWAVWKFFASRGISFKKKPAALRTNPPRHCPPARAMAAAAKANRSSPPGLYR